ncbi:MAG: MmcB family DNA repair protein [Pseudomonadota bacterium]
MTMDADLSAPPLQPGQLLARGVARHLRDHDFTCLGEFSPERGKRLDVMALGPKGEFWVVECKSSRSDFTSDGKWDGYLEWADRFFWAVDTSFPVDLLPQDTGLIIADGFDAEVIRMPEAHPLAPARRKALTLRFARCAALRMHHLRDPMLSRAY